MNKTLDYYDNNAKAFAENTFNIVFSEIQDMFLGHLKYGAAVLDFPVYQSAKSAGFREWEYSVDEMG